MSRVLLATKNAGKVAELQRILTPFGLVLEGASYDPGPETGSSFAVGMALVLYSLVQS